MRGGRRSQSQPKERDHVYLPSADWYDAFPRSSPALADNRLEGRSRTRAFGRTRTSPTGTTSSPTTTPGWSSATAPLSESQTHVHVLAASSGDSAERWAAETHGRRIRESRLTPPIALRVSVDGASGRRRPRSASRRIAPPWNSLSRPAGHPGRVALVAGRIAKRAALPAEFRPFSPGSRHAPHAHRSPGVQ